MIKVPERENKENLKEIIKKLISEIFSKLYYLHSHTEGAQDNVWTKE